MKRILRRYPHSVSVPFQVQPSLRIEIDGVTYLFETYQELLTVINGLLRQVAPLRFEEDCNTFPELKEQWEETQKLLAVMTAFFTTEVDGL